MFQPCEASGYQGSRVLEHNQTGRFSQYIEVELRARSARKLIERKREERGKRRKDRRYVTIEDKKERRIIIKNRIEY